MCFTVLVAPLYGQGSWLLALPASGSREWLNKPFLTPSHLHSYSAFLSCTLFNIGITNYTCGMISPSQRNFDLPISFKPTQQHNSLTFKCWHQLYVENWTQMPFLTFKGIVHPKFFNFVIIYSHSNHSKPVIFISAVKFKKRFSEE